MDDLYRVECAVSATSSGNLCWERWPINHAVALGFAGQRNPLGFAVVRFLSDAPGSSSVWAVELALITDLIKRGFEHDVARDAARAGFAYWRDSRCLSCHGRGITDQEQRVCPSCGGTGKRKLTNTSDPVKQAVSALIEAEQRMEGQLNARLR